jgi:hypothetical protein
VIFIAYVFRLDSFATSKETECFVLISRGYRNGNLPRLTLLLMFRCAKQVFVGSYLADETGSFNHSITCFFSEDASSALKEDQNLCVLLTMFECWNAVVCQFQDVGMATDVCHADC